MVRAAASIALLAAGLGALASPALSAPPEASGGARFGPLPPRARTLCADAQRHSPRTILCPQRLPRPWLGWPRRDRPAPFSGEIIRLGGAALGVELKYGAPIEPGSGSASWVRDHLWLNRPCCSLHLVVFRLPPTMQIPSGARAARLGGRTGLLLEALGYGLAGSAAGRGTFWPNHTWFFWREHGARYAASVHFFGRGPTRLLLGQTVAVLAPVVS